MAEEVFWFQRSRLGDGPAGLLLGEAPNPLPEWIISDTHFGHRRIAELAGRPADHERLMLERWCARVGEHETVLHLGDVCWRSNGWVERLSDLPGRVLLVRGNHDKSRDVSRYRRIGWILLEPFVFGWCGWNVLVTHIPVELRRLPGGALNLHGHTHEDLLDDDRHINACVEQQGYGPVRLSDLLDRHLAAMSELRLPEGA